MTWLDANEVVPATPAPCVVLVPTNHGFLERTFAQYQNGRWYYSGSDAQARDVRYWLPLPAMPNNGKLGGGR